MFEHFSVYYISVCVDYQEACIRSVPVDPAGLFKTKLHFTAMITDPSEPRIKTKRKAKALYPVRKGGW